MGRIQGKVVFIPMTLPGETHKIEVVQEKKGYSRGESLELLELTRQPYVRTAPFCPHYGICGGCNLQHISYEDQLSVKKEIAIDHYNRLGGITFARNSIKEPKIVRSPDKAYRNRIQLHFKEGKLGFKKRKSHNIVDIKNCPLLVKGINDYLEEERENDFDEKRINIFGTQESSWVEGRDRKISLPVKNRLISFSPELFFQSNLTLLPALLDQVCQFAGQGEHFLDLYSGVGLFAAFLEDSFQSGTAVESARGALKFGKENLKKTEYYEKKVEDWAKRRQAMSLDFAVVDPPRTGLSRETVDLLGKLKPRRLAYVSCNPVTHGRDLKLLSERGFQLDLISLYDFYPHTSHLESLALLKYHG
jgi:23S rRNA (uracil1939-C5)-methyltransferase